MKNPTASPKTPVPVSALCFGLAAVVLVLLPLMGREESPVRRASDTEAKDAPVETAMKQVVPPDSVSLSALLDQPVGDREAWLARVSTCLEGPLSAVEQEDLVTFLMAPANGTVGRRVWEEVRKRDVSRLLPGEDEGRVRFRYEPPPSPFHPSVRFGPRRQRFDPLGPPG